MVSSTVLAAGSAALEIFVGEAALTASKAVNTKAVNRPDREVIRIVACIRGFRCKEIGWPTGPAKTILWATSVVSQDRAVGGNVNMTLPTLPASVGTRFDVKPGGPPTQAASATKRQQGSNSPRL